MTTNTKELTLCVAELPSAKLLPNNAASERYKRDMRSRYRKRVAKSLRKTFGLVGDGGPKSGGTYLLCPLFSQTVKSYDLDITIFWPSNRRRPDNDGALSSLKGLLDAVADVLGVDDRHCDTLTIRQRRAGVGSEGNVELRYALRYRDPAHAFCNGACLRTDSATLDIDTDTL